MEGTPPTQEKQETDRWSTKVGGKRVLPFLFASILYLYDETGTCPSISSAAPSGEGGGGGTGADEEALSCVFVRAHTCNEWSLFMWSAVQHGQHQGKNAPTETSTLR
ncbi:unnamed protein product, partial [Ectocarpus sp. 12 AP-2014]